MKKLSLAFTLLALASVSAAQDSSIHCQSCDDWNRPQAPFNVYGNTWYVGTAGLSALLVTGPQGHILLDGGLPQSAPLIEKNIAALGFRIQDVKLIVNSHAHFDHAGGIAALQRASGAVVAGSAASAKGMQLGTNIEDDPQFEPDGTRFPKIAKVKVVADGETLDVGPLKLTMHLTPGHTPGGTTWTWSSCEKGKCADMVYAESLTAVSSDDFHFTGDATHPDISKSFLATIDKVRNLPCDVIVSTHPSFTQTFEKLAARTPANNTFVTPGGCRAYADAAGKALATRLDKERREKAAAH
ncbi:subclass B3 metallo-beta-lactamase [Massilia horti]|uniref:Subclass B3 metallo-beta-lactamase n=1 Tax=Massilia horti TaxID=2562153 RepID=A0A4Y9T189_9BURK|nr:subclass B3 metallo-beta-lactamase [Massilia horti]TFW30766.1 subclass B3 metallo-beta-lactamase [Massilia horti]